MTNPIKMNILILNPNSDPDMTGWIQKTAQEFSHYAGPQIFRDLHSRTLHPQQGSPGA
jgi:hypothetical protein